MKKNILIADDERTNALLLAKRLEKEGYKVFTAANGVQALEIIKSEHIDILITDVVMPEMDGVDLYMNLKQDPATKALPIIIVTDKDIFRESFSTLGVEFFSPKPFNFSDLMNKIIKVSSQAQEIRNFHKVVAFGPDRDVLDKMAELLEKRNCIVTVVDNVIEVGFKCFLTSPNIILMDLHSREYATTKELIRSIRCYDFFKKTSVVIYSNFTPGDMGVLTGLDSLEEEIHTCLECGANKYIGRFNRVTFLEQLQEFGI